MATTEFNKEYLDYTKKEAKNWHLYMGGLPELISGRTNSYFDWGRDVNFLYKIRESDVNFVTNRVDWERRSSFVPWTLNSDDNEVNLVFNSNNNIAYLCISDNFANRSDISIRGKNPSVLIPSHTVGIQTYEDGYSWHALFSVDPSNINLLSPTTIPVVSINEYSNEPKTSTLEYKYGVKCGSGYKTIDGTCCLYPKEKFIDGVGVTQDKGSLSPIKFVSKCYQCYETAQKLNYEYNFISGVTLQNLYPSCTPCDCTYSVLSPIEKIENDKNNINPSGSLFFLYNSYSNWIENKKGILSVFIDLESLTEEEKTVSVESPYVYFTSISGSNGLAQLVTQEINSKHVVTGIQLISRGSGYDLGDAIPLINSTSSPVLTSRIQVNIAPEDFPEIPHVMLNNMKTCIKVNIDNNYIKTGVESNISEFTRYGLIKNVKDRNGDSPSANGLNENEFQILRATTLLTLSASGTNNLITQNPKLLITNGTIVRLSDREIKKGEVAYFKYTVNANKEVTGAVMELVTKNYDNIEIGDYITVDPNFSYIVSAINKPDVSFASGQILLKKETSIKFPTSDNFVYQPKKSVTFTILKS